MPHTRAYRSVHRRFDKELVDQGREPKQANVKVTPEGVKNLDFGLAKAMEPPPSEEGNPENSTLSRFRPTQPGGHGESKRFPSPNPFRPASVGPVIGSHPLKALYR